MTSFAQIALRVPRWHSTERRAPQDLPETCSGVSARHDGLRVATYVIGRANPHPVRLCSGCLEYVRELGLVYADRRS